MKYEHHVFISYSRACEWPGWVCKHFVPLLTHWLSAELGHQAQVFCDYQIEAGVSWPRKLAQELSCSAVIVPLLTRNYFSSKWCTLEMGHVWEREKLCGYRSDTRPEGLIVPAIIHDGKDFRHGEMGMIQAVDLSEWANVRMAVDSPAAEQLSARVREWAPCIKHAIDIAPPPDPRWVSISAEQFVAQYYSPAPVQSSVPRWI